ncbi:PTPRQ [Bugula neritina]|uniref:protein-tyrosine-phosphatase n=1 Tax=Bugula neritina TaxID=10212 RepID=A0A7J7K0D9_BUGNE|nr:PTPRQ [Bugula neritina]
MLAACYMLCTSWYKYNTSYYYSIYQTRFPSDVVPTRANPSGTNITLEWTYNDTHVVSGFRLSCIPAVGLCGDRNSPLDIPDKTVRTYTLPGATPGRVYNVSIQAYVNTVQSGWVDFNEVEPGLSSPENLRITERRDTSVTLKWDEPPGMSDISYYEVNYTDSYGKLTSVNTTGIGPLMIDNLTEGHGYTFAVKYVSSTGKRSPPSNEVKYTIAPTIPESVEVKIPPGSSMLNFTWSLGSGRRDGFETVLFTPEGNITDTVSGSITFKEYSSLSPDTLYSFTVRAQAADVERPGYYKYSNYTERVDVTTDEDKPDQVADLTATGATSSSVTLTWNKPVQENGVVVAYVIQTILLSNSICVSFTLISCEDCRRREHNYTTAINEKVVECTNRLDDVIKKSADFSSISYTVTELSAFTNYTFVVWAFNTKEPSLKEENAATLENPPNAPDTVNILSYTHSSIHINWTRVSSEGVGVIEGYRISVLPSHTASIDVLADDPLEYNITDLEPYINYTVSVQAKTSGGYGAPQDIHQITKQYFPTKPRLTSNPSAGIETSGSTKLPYIDISWEEPIPPNGVITGYLIQWKEVLNPPSSEAETEEVDSTARSYRITSGLSHNKKYTVSIQARTEYLQNSPEGWGEAANRTVSTLESTPTAVPKVSNEVKEQLSVEEQISQISFYLPSDLTTMFSLDSGNIIKYQILVIGQVSNQQFREDKLSNAVPGIASWAEAKKGDFKEPYAISAPEKSPSDWPTNSNRKKRAVASSTQINVGTDSSCKDEDTRLCNGPLKSNQQYCVYVRGFTSAGYSDSDCIVEAKTKLNYTPIIVGVVVAVALLVVLALLVYIFRRQQQTK